MYDFKGINNLINKAILKFILPCAWFVLFEITYFANNMANFKQSATKKTGAE